MENWIVASLAIFSIFGHVTGSCGSFAGNIEHVQLNTTVHTPLATNTETTLLQCIQGCFHVTSCNKINYAISSGTCHFFDINGPETVVSSPVVQWTSVALSTVQLPEIPFICTSNPCAVGQACFDNGSEQLCTDLYSAR